MRVAAFLCLAVLTGAAHAQTAFSIPPFTLTNFPVQSGNGLPAVVNGFSGAGPVAGELPLALSDYPGFPLYAVGPDAFGDPSVVPLPAGDTWIIQNSNPGAVSSVLGTVDGVNPALVVQALVQPPASATITIGDTAGYVTPSVIQFNIWSP